MLSPEQLRQNYVCLQQLSSILQIKFRQNLCLLNEWRFKSVLALDLLLHVSVIATVLAHS